MVLSGRFSLIISPPISKLLKLGFLTSTQPTGDAIALFTYKQYSIDLIKKLRDFLHLGQLSDTIPKLYHL